VDAEAVELCVVVDVNEAAVFGCCDAWLQNTLCDGGQRLLVREG
jgi:hypothetical protein